MASKENEGQTSQVDSPNDQIDTHTPKVDKEDAQAGLTGLRQSSSSPIKPPEDLRKENPNVSPIPGSSKSFAAASKEETMASGTAHGVSTLSLYQTWQAVQQETMELFEFDEVLKKDLELMNEKMNLANQLLADKKEEIKQIVELFESLELEDDEEAQKRQEYIADMRKVLEKY